MALSELAHLERYQGNYPKALSLYGETILAWQDLGHRAAVAHQLECIAFIAGELRDDQRAVLLLGAAEALRERIATPMTVLEQNEYDPVVNSLHARLEEHSFAHAWSRGRAMTMEEAISYALEPLTAG